MDFGRLLSARKVGDLELVVALDVGKLLLAKIYDLVGVFDDRGGVRAHEVLVFADADNQRTALAGCYHTVREPLVNDGDGVGTDDVLERNRYSLLQRELAGVHYVLDELHHDFSVGLAVEVIAFIHKGSLEGLVVLDDAVMDNHQVMVLRHVRMGIDIAWFAVGCPSGVGYAYASALILSLGYSLKVCDLAFGLVNGELAIVINEGDTGAVVPSVLKPLEALDQNRKGLTPSDISNNSTHKN